VRLCKWNDFARRGSVTLPIAVIKSATYAPFISERGSIYRAAPARWSRGLINRRRGNRAARHAVEARREISLPCRGSINNPSSWLEPGKLPLHPRAGKIRGLYISSKQANVIRAWATRTRSERKDCATSYERGEARRARSAWRVFIIPVLFFFHFAFIALLQTPQKRFAEIARHSPEQHVDGFIYHATRVYFIPPVVARVTRDPAQVAAYPLNPRSNSPREKESLDRLLPVISDYAISAIWYVTLHAMLGDW